MYYYDIQHGDQIAAFTLCDSFCTPIDQVWMVLVLHNFMYKLSGKIIFIVSNIFLSMNIFIVSDLQSSFHTVVMNCIVCNK